LLRITPTTTSGPSITLRLEGKITADWVDVLEKECRALIRKRKRVRLDFLDVSYMGFDGVEMLRNLPIGTVTIVNAPEFITDLLDRRGM